MAKMPNPFEHHHDHGDEPGHAHDHGLPVAELDPAQQSLADALRVSFAILKVVMLVLVVAYLFSGFFSVPADQAAVRLRFGEIVGGASADDQVLPPGGPHLALPYPLEQVLYVPTSPQRLSLHKEFWFELTGQTAEKDIDEALGKAGPLNPEKDGSLLTGDANLVHARLTIIYAVKGPVGGGRFDPAAVVAYVRNVGDQASAERLVRGAAEQAVVYAFAQLPSADVARRQVNTAVVRARAQAVLDQLHTGLEIREVLNDKAAFPESVREAMRSVINAEDERAKALESARQYRDSVLIQTAGEAARPLLELIEQYELASQAGDQARLAALDARLYEAFETLRVSGSEGPVEIRGDIRRTLDEARSYRTQVVNLLRTEADTFTKLRQQYQKSPEVFTNRLWQDAMQEILASKDVETFYLLPGQTYLELNRDPKIRKEREQERLRAMEKRD